MEARSWLYYYKRSRHLDHDESPAQAALMPLHIFHQLTTARLFRNSPLFLRNYYSLTSTFLTTRPRNTFLFTADLCYDLSLFKAEFLLSISIYSRKVVL